MPFVIRFSFAGLDLLNRGLRRQYSTEIFSVHFPKHLPFRQIIQRLKILD